MLTIVDIDLSKQLKLSLLLHGVLLCFTCAVDGDDHQMGVMYAGFDIYSSRHARMTLDSRSINLALHAS